MSAPSISRFSREPAALERYHPDHGCQVWVVPQLVLEPGMQAVVVLGDDDPRTVFVEEVILDSPDEARWTIGNTTCLARAVRPYDAISIGLSDHPMAPEEIMAGSHGGFGEAVEHPLGCRLDLDPATVWVDEDTQRERAVATAQAIEHDLAGEQIQDWRLHVQLGLLGWAPTKVPLKRRELSYANTRFVTPAVAEQLWRGDITPKEWRREHIVPRALLTAEWREAADLDELVQSVWDYRFAVVLTTREEDKRITRAAADRWERYVEAGIPTVYDRLHRRDIHVAAVDPRSEWHAVLDKVD